MLDQNPLPVMLDYETPQPRESAWSLANGLIAFFMVIILILLLASFG